MNVLCNILRLVMLFTLF